MPAEADRGDRADGHWPAELCQYVGHKDHGAEKRICGLSEPWHDKRTAAVAFAHHISFKIQSCIFNQDS
mgnify:CR=1 FL=1